MRTARRSQIVEAAIDTIATEGLARASFARIARTAGLSSTGLISYHFAGKQELMDEVVRVVLAEFAAFVEERMTAETGPAAELRAFIVANVEFASKHRTRLLAALDIARAGRAPAFGVDVAGLAELLRVGQRYGEFRFFDADLMAMAVRSVLDGVLNRLAVDPDADHGAYTEELATLFELATRGA